MDIRTYLKDHILLFDGAMGTYCAEIAPACIGTPCELWSITYPEKIEAIHRAYLDAGAKAIKTNTFSANRMTLGEENCKKAIGAAVEIASKFRDRAFVFADIGPLTITDNDDRAAEYRFVADCFLELGADCFLFETNSTWDGIPEAAAYIKEKNKDAFILVSFASLPDGFTRAGRSAELLITEADRTNAVDAVGLNCASGAHHMARMIGEMKMPRKPFSAMPNAGYPTVLGNRTFYDGTPAYFAEQIREMAAMGVKILGGCCGTTPDHIAAASKALHGSAVAVPKTVPKAIAKQEKKSAFWEALCDQSKRPFAVELDPPETSELGKFMEGAKRMQAEGAAALTIADCPIGRPRMDSSLLACKLHRELGVEALPHMTCRDRNLNAIKALLLGLCAEEVHQVLVVTGDPIPSADRDEVKSVYNFNSRMLAAYITALSEKSLTTPFRVFGALNVNAKNFDMQLRMAKEKEANGVCGFLTQPILTEAAFENLKRAKKELHAKLLGGIFPIVSYKNACYLHSEVTGIKVDPRIIDRYEGKGREEAEEIALELSVRIAKACMPYVDGYYLMTPFSRTELMAKIMREIRSFCP